jgi:phosphoinositide-3-kinase regulatory subunit 4
MIGEHTAAVSRVLVAADHSFFITGSDDGSVKVWDSWRLERNITHRSRQTFKLNEGARISSLAFIENTYSFVCTGSDGSAFVVRVDYQQLPGGGTKYGRLKMLREYQLPEGEHAVWSDHYKSDAHSVLILATNNSRIIALELRTMTELYVLENPLQHGTPTCFCLDRRQYWLMLGTSHGVIDLWDLRFKLRLKAWAFQGASPIHRIIHQPLGRSKFRLHVAGGTGQGEVTVWNMEKLVCKEVYRTGLCKDNSKGMVLIDVDEEGSGGMLSRFATSLEPSGNMSVDRGIRAMAIRTQLTEKGKDYETKQLFSLTAGPDWKVRFWDTVRYEGSMVVSGMELDEVKPQYTISQPSTETIAVSERLALPHNQQSSSSGRDGSRASSNTSAKRGGTKPSRSSIISLQQQHLLRSHMDSILDVALLEYPYGMVISADRSGIIYVFQ